MIYPDWAPESLVDLHKLRTNRKAEGKKTNGFNPDVVIAEMRKDERYKSYGEEQFKQVYESLYRRNLGLLPSEESDALLLKLIFDLRMKVVWLSLARRKNTNSDATRFWMACEGAVGGWRGEPKTTVKERLQILSDIQESLKSLQANMHKVREFEFYSINQLIDNQSIKWLLETLDAELSLIDEGKALDYASFCLGEIIPQFDLVLMDIHAKANELKKESVIVKKPNSENAKIHYFVRQLSSFFQDYFGQPLHESVAITTSVALSVEEIDADYVRKLVKT